MPTLVRRPRSSRTTAYDRRPVSRFLSDAAHDGNFWATTAQIQVALLLAIILEGREARDAFQRGQIRARTRALRKANEAADRWAAEIGGYRDPDDPDELPSLVVPHVLDDETQTVGGIVLMAAFAVPGLAIGIVVSLIALSPVGYAGAVPMTIALVWTALTMLMALVVLTIALLSRLGLELLPQHQRR
jgi:hypothetical protein